MKQQHGASASRVHRRRLPAALVAAFTVTVSTLAILHQGVTTAEVDVDDGGIWVTNTSKRLVGHLNYDSRILDGALRTKTTEFDIGQSGNDVSFTDKTSHSVAPIDVAQVSVGAATSLPENAKVVQGGSRLAVMDASQGQVWLAQVSSPSGTAYTDEGALASDMEQGAVAVSQKGTLFAISAQGGRRITVTREGQLNRLKSQDVEGLSGNAELLMTAVGEQPVALDQRNRVLVLPDGKLRNLADDGISGNITLQESGPESSSVLLATDRELISIPLKGGAATKIPASNDGASGKPSRPVFHKGCAYAAWSKSGAYLRNCTDPSLNKQMTVDSLKSAQSIVFRTNRTRIVLNDTTSGSVWMPEHDMVLMNDWDQIESQLEKKEKQEDSPQVTDQIADPERKEQNTPPDAVNDDFGIRPGRTTTLPVLNNDSDADGDVLTARPVTDPQFGKVTRTRGGRALQITDVPDNQTGSTSFTYEASDGKAVATARVNVTVHPWEMNSGPKQLRDPGVTLGNRAQIEYNVLNDWQDPDGDPIFLANAHAPEGIELQFREEGTLQIRDLGASVGAHTITLEVSDGRQSTTGTLTVNVQNPGNLPPVANADFYVARAGEVATISPLANDTDPNGDNLSLVALSVAPAGSQITPDLELGTVNFVAQAPGSYQFTYTVSDGPSTALGVIRVDVVEADQQAVPVAEDDLAVLPAGGSALVAPLNNDSDPAGGVLVVQRVEVPANLGLEVTLVDRHLLRITAPGGLESSVSFDYVVSNGTNTAKARITVVPTSAQDTKQPPELQPDRTRVRVGDIASVPVLANDRSPSGLSLKVDPNLQFTPNEAVGTPFVTGNLVRLEAGNTPGVMHVAYTVRDSAGNMSTSTVTFEVLPKSGTNAQPQPKALTAWAVSGEATRIPVPLNGIDPDGDSLTLEENGIETATPELDPQVRSSSTLQIRTPSQAGTYLVSYTVSDGRGGSARGTVTVFVQDDAPLKAPIARDDYVAYEDLPTDGSAVRVKVLENDEDPDGSIDELSVTTAESGVSVDGADLLIPVTDTLRLVVYTITDRDGQTNSAVVNVPGRDTTAPFLSAAGLPIEMDAGTSRTIDLSDYVVTRPGRSPRLVDGTSPVIQTGLDSVVADSSTQLTLTATATFGGNSAFLIQVADGDADDAGALSASLSLPVRIKATTNQPPTFAPTAIRVEAGGSAVTQNLALAVRDPEGTDASTFTYAMGSAPSSVSASLDGTVLTVSAPEEATAGSAGSIAVSVTDEQGNTVNASIPVEIVTTTKPRIQVPPYSVNAKVGETVIVDVASRATNPFPDTPISLVGAAVSLGDADIASSGTSVMVTPRSAGTISVGYQVNDKLGDPSRVVQGTITVTVTGKPDAPTNVQAEAVGTSAARVTFSAPTSNGSPITGYRLYDATGTKVADCSSTVCVVSGLTVGRSYTYTVTAVNAIGESAHSASSSVSISGAPSQPAQPSATAGNTTIDVSWTAPADNGSPITGYTVTATTANGPAGSCSTTGATSCTISGLRNGQNYTVTVVARNANGDSPASSGAQATPTAPRVGPDQPTITNGNTIQQRDGNGALLTITWSLGSPGSAEWGETVVSVNGTTKKVPGGQTSTQMTVPYGMALTAYVTVSNKNGDTATSPAYVIPALVHEDLTPPKTIPVAPDAPNVRTPINNEWGKLSVYGARVKEGNGFKAADLTLFYTHDPNGCNASANEVGLEDFNIGTLTAGATMTYYFCQRARGAAGPCGGGPPAAASGVVGSGQRDGGGGDTGDQIPPFEVQTSVSGTSVSAKLNTPSGVTIAKTEIWIAELEGSTKQTVVGPLTDWWAGDLPPGRDLTLVVHVTGSNGQHREVRTTFRTAEHPANIDATFEGKMACGNGQECGSMTLRAVNAQKFQSGVTIVCSVKTGRPATITEFRFSRDNPQVTGILTEATTAAELLAKHPVTACHAE